MPQLVKGGKWVFGWVVVGRHGELVIPSEAWEEYGFQSGEEVVFLPGSRSSGSFGLSTPRLLGQLAGPMQMRILAWDQIRENGQVVVLGAVGARPGDRLLAVRGSGRALGFVARGPIYDEAIEHAGLGTFKPQS